MTMRDLFLFLIRQYQRFLSPAAAALGAQCRFYPSCSEYAALAFEKMPWWKAGFYTFKRLIKCGPWHKGGIDTI